MKRFLALRGIGSIFDMSGFSWVELFQNHAEGSARTSEILLEDEIKMTRDIKPALNRVLKSAAVGLLSPKEPV